MEEDTSEAVSLTKDEHLERLYWNLQTYFEELYEQKPWKAVQFWYWAGKKLNGKPNE